MEVAGDVLTDRRATAFGMAHFAQDAAAGTGDAFDGVDGAVRIELWVHRGGSVEVGVLRGNLTGGGELFDVFFGCIELSFAVGKGDVVKVPDLGVC